MKLLLDLEQAAVSPVVERLGTEVVRMRVAVLVSRPAQESSHVRDALLVALLLAYPFRYTIGTVPRQGLWGLLPVKPHRP